MNTNERIAAIRVKMEQKGIDAILIPSSDPHLSEYVSAHWKTRAFVSGFSGSAGTFVITKEMSGLWTDGRYYVQAANELSGSEAKLFRAAEPDCPTPVKFLAGELKQGGKVGLNGRLFSESEVAKMKKAFAKKSLEIDIQCDFANEIWSDRPEEELTEVYLLDPCYTGKSAKEKLSELRKALAEADADAMAVNKLDNIAWLFNIRSQDIENNPVVISYAFIGPDEAFLFTNTARVPAAVAEALQAEGVTIRPYDEIYDFLSSRKEKNRVLCDQKAINSGLYASVKENPNLTPVDGTDPIFMMKACKNPVESRNTHNAYLKDGCALAEFYGWLYEALERGETLTEWDCSQMLAKFRIAQPLNRGDSFTAIVAYRENAAMMHYAPKENGSKVLEKSHMLLVDSGGQYLDGTTDITRTFALGPISEEERHDSTLALKGSIALMEAVFKAGTSGSGLDILCREPFWKEGLDYRCGTGHGVGFMLNVHEGPQGFGSPVKLTEGMVITVEPGVYTEGSHGIRTENVVEVIKGEKTEYAQFLCFEVYTLVPIDANCLDLAMMTDHEIDWLNQYHKRVFEKLSPLVSDRAKKWLALYTKEVARP